MFDQAWEIVRNAAWEMHPEVALSRNFSKEAIAQIMPIIAKYEKECEDGWTAEVKIADAVAAHSAYFDDEALYEVSAYACVYDDHVEFIALETGYGDRSEGRSPGKDL